MDGSQGLVKADFPLGKSYIPEMNILVAKNLNRSRSCFPVTVLFDQRSKL